MTDTVIAQIDGRTLIVRDRDGDGAYEPADATEPANHGDRIGLRLRNGQVIFDEDQVRAAMAQVGLHHIDPNGRIPSLATYIDQIRLAQRATQSADIHRVDESLETAEELAIRTGLGVDREQLADIRWQAIDNWLKQYEEGDAQVHQYVTTLRQDDDIGDNTESAALILRYLRARQDGQGITSFQQAIERRYQRVRFILEQGGHRRTDVPQVTASGRMVRIGDPVLFAGYNNDQPRPISAFRLSASRISAFFTDGTNFDINILDSMSPPPSQQQPATREGKMQPLSAQARIRSAVRSVRSWLGSLGRQLGL